MKKPIIGLMPLWDEQKQSLWMLPGYADGILAAGGIPVMLPLTSDASVLLQLAKTCDGFLFTGGQDVSPELYNSSPQFDNIICCENRDAMELILLKEILKTDKPILGICRGIQFINAALGGTLYQDLPHELGVLHCQKPPYDKAFHEVTIIKDSPLYELLKTEKTAVNSYHHQAVKTISTRLLPMAVSVDGITEALYMPGKKFVWAVQWHPEFSFKSNNESMEIFRHFINCCI